MRMILVLMNVLTKPVLKLKAREGLSSMQPRVTVEDALYLPTNGQNLLSMAKFKKAGASCHFAERDEIVTKD